MLNQRSFSRNVMRKCIVPWANNDSFIMFFPLRITKFCWKTSESLKQTSEFRFGYIYYITQAQEDKGTRNVIKLHSQVKIELKKLHCQFLLEPLKHDTFPALYHFLVLIYCFFRAYVFLIYAFTANTHLHSVILGPATSPLGSPWKRWRCNKATAFLKMSLLSLHTNCTVWCIQFSSLPARLVKIRRGSHLNCSVRAYYTLR